MKVNPCVDRILLFADELVGEMHPIYGDTKETYFNGTIPVCGEENAKDSITAVCLCYVMGTADVPARQVFSRPFQSRPPDANSDVMGNAICVNYFNPTLTDHSSSSASEQPLATAKICLVDISERLQTGLGLPSVIILQRGNFVIDRSDKAALERVRQHGIDPDATGNFVKKIEHLWPMSEKVAKALSDENVRISLYAHSVVNTLEPI